MSITRDQMSLQIDRLVDVFGEKAFSEQRQHMIWEVLDGLDYKLVIGIVDMFIRANKYAPLPVDFSKACEGMDRGGMKRQLGEYAEHPACGDCHDSGFVSVERKDEHEEWARCAGGSAACHCERGRQVLFTLRNSPKHPVDLKCQWGPQWEASYAIVGRG